MEILKDNGFIYVKIERLATYNMNPGREYEYNEFYSIGHINYLITNHFLRMELGFPYEPENLKALWAARNFLLKLGAKEPYRSRELERYLYTYKHVISKIKCDE